MSWTTGTQTEALAASTVIPSAYNTFTSVQYIGTPTAAGYLPANFFLPSYGSGKSVLMRTIIGLLLELDMRQGLLRQELERRLRTPNWTPQVEQTA